MTMFHLFLSDNVWSNNEVELLTELFKREVCGMNGEGLSK